MQGGLLKLTLETVKVNISAGSAVGLHWHGSLAVAGFGQHLRLLKSPCAARMFHGAGNRLLAALCPGIRGASWLDVSDWLALLFSSRVVCLCPMSHFFSSLVLFLCTDRHIVRTVLFFINFLGL